MIYLKQSVYKRKKKNYFLIIVIFALVFESIMLVSNKLKGENDEENNVEKNIENAMQYVVAITKENGLLESNSSTWGSGVIVSKKGYIITNSHVCGDVGSVCNITVNEDNYCRGVVVWSSIDLDLAMIKVNQNFSNCINLGDSDNIKVGQTMYTIGNPINKSFQKSVSKGIISGLNRSLGFEEQGAKYYMTDLIQTDAVINYGNSGGAFVDEAGDLVGICTMKITDAELMGFCVKTNIIKPVIEKFEKNGNFDEVNLGIWCYDKYSIKETDLNKRINSGLYIAQVDSNSPSELAGIRVGDVITYADTKELNTVSELKEFIFSKEDGDNIIFKVNRDNREFIINVKPKKEM